MTPPDRPHPLADPLPGHGPPPGATPPDRPPAPTPRQPAAPPPPRPSPLPSRPGPALLRVSLAGSLPELGKLAGWTVLSAAPAALSGKALALAVDRGFLARQPTTGLAWLALFATAAAVSAWGARNAYRPLARIVEPARDRLLRATADGALRQTAATRPDPDTAAVAVARITRQVEAVRDSLAGQLLLVSHLVLTLAAVVVGIAALAPAALVPVCAPLLLSVAAFATLTPRMARRQRELFATEEELTASALRTMTALRDLTVCGAEQRAVDRVLADVAANEGAGRALARLAAARHLLVALGVHGPLAVLTLTAPTLLHHGLSPGALLGALAYLLGTLEPALRLLVQGLGPSWLRMSVAAERLATTATATAPPAAPAATTTPAALPEAPPAAPPPPVRRRSRRPALELRGVDFSWGREAQPVLCELHLTLRDGESLAVVGPSGAGKSTLGALAAGLLHPDRGRVLLSGLPVDRLSPAALAALRVLLPQEPYVFTGTLAENLRWPDPALPTGRLQHALRALGAHSLTDRHGGLDGQVGPAVLSPGERQLVALVRAYLSPAPLTILDEATSHLDATTELRIDQAFRTRPGALLTITHHPSQAARADRVLHLDTAAWSLTHHAR
ncbi:ATP-binding cassette domain-containing protein [Kitasatospora sp. NPDC092948]|uniref:ATP-binding cassette domain-containing protein n=1 Tax=Kitasatospora sp. NPDC092948 TaxID=3364088 RepID=UPI003823D5E4